LPATGKPLTVGRMESTVVGRLRLEVRGGTLDLVGAKHAPTITIGDAPVVIGRSKGCTLVLDDKQVSKVHAELVATEFGVRLRDLGSRNGTYAGDHRVGELFLTSAAVVQCGDSYNDLQMLARSLREDFGDDRTFRMETSDHLTPLANE
jgi:hypothetical protein